MQNPAALEAVVETSWLVLETMGKTAQDRIPVIAMIVDRITAVGSLKQPPSARK